MTTRAPVRLAAVPGLDDLDRCLAGLPPSDVVAAIQRGLIWARAGLDDAVCWTPYTPDGSLQLDHELRVRQWMTLIGACWGALAVTRRLASP